MKDILSILFGAGFTVAVSLAIGSLLLRALRVPLFRVEATLFWKLLKTIGVPDAKDRFWYVVNSWRVPVAWLRRLYQRWRYAS